MGGILIGIANLVHISGAASLAALLLYAFVGPALCMVTLVPTLPVNRPGVLYAAIFFIVNILFVAWVKHGIRRHIDRDGEDKPLPAGSEKLFEAWSKIVF